MSCMLSFRPAVEILNSYSHLSPLDCSPVRNNRSCQCFDESEMKYRMTQNETIKLTLLGQLAQRDLFNQRAIEIGMKSSKGEIPRF